MLIIRLTGAGVGEGDAYQGVHADDGSAAVGSLDHLVHQTVSLPLRLHRGCYTTPQGNGHNRVEPC